MWTIQHNHYATLINDTFKKIAVKKFEEARKNDKNAVQLGCSPFDNKRLGIAPKNIVENLIGISFSDIEGEKNGYIKDKEI